MIREEDEPLAREFHRDFCQSWGISKPLRSADIRSRSDDFHWLSNLNAEMQSHFYETLYKMMASAPVLGIACVVDRPGYNDRYKGRYGEKRWLLCKTAFAVVVERAAKYARKLGYKMRVFPERGDPDADRRAKTYYAELQATGMPFAAATSEKYGPLSATDFRETLYDFKTKFKSSPMAQLADLYLWPMCMGGYNPNVLPYRRLLEDRKLVDCHLSDEEKPHLGIKYSCWELVEAQKTKARDSSRALGQPPDGATS